MAHPKPEEILQLFLSVEDESRETLLHLLLCAPCRARAAMAPEPERASDAEDGPLAFGLAKILARTGEVARRFTALLEGDRARAPRLLEELKAHPDPAAAIETEARFRSPGLARLLLLEAFADVEDEPVRAETVAGRVLALVPRIAAGPFPECAALELAAWADCLLADARRRRGDLAGAEEALLAAARELDSEPLDSPDKVLFCRTLARVRRQQGRIEEALALLGRAARLCETLEVYRELGEVFEEEARLRLDDGEAETALPVFRAALALLDARTPPRVLLRTYQGLALALADSGERAAARRALLISRKLYPFLPGPLDRPRAQAWEAELALRSGRRRRAAEVLERAVERFLESGAPHDAGIATLRLAGLDLDQTKAGRLDALERRVTPALETLGADPRAARIFSAALAAAQRQQKGAAGLLERAAEDLDRSRFFLKS